MPETKKNLILISLFGFLLVVLGTGFAKPTKAQIRNGTCHLAAYVNTDGSVFFKGSVSAPFSTDVITVTAQLYLEGTPYWVDSNPWQTNTGDNSVSVSGTYANYPPNPPGTTWQAELIGSDGASCSATTNFTVLPSPATVIVNSETNTGAPIYSCWDLNGPSPVTGDCGTSVTYTPVTAGTYSVNPYPLSGYTVTVQPSSATVSGGGTITLNIIYSNAPPPGGTCTDPSATNYGGALPCTYPPGGICNDPNATNYGGALPCTYPPGICSDPAATNYGGALPCTYPSQVICAPSNSSVNPGQSITFSAVNGSGSFAWSAPGANPSSAGNVSTFTTSYASAGNYTVRVTRGTWATCSVTVVAIPPPPPPPAPPAPAPTISFAITYGTTPGTINVSSNTPTHWRVSGGNGPFDGAYPSTTATYSAAPANYTFAADTLTGFAAPVVTDGTNSIDPAVARTLASGSTITYKVYYLAIPQNVSVNNSGCNQIRVSWTGAGPTVSYFQVWRSATAGGPYTGPNWTLISGNLSNSTTSYLDSTVTANNTYHYVVKSFLNSPSMTATSSEVSAFAIECIANLGLSKKQITYVQYSGLGGSWSAYDPTRIIPNNTGVRFMITITNSGSEKATIPSIQDTLSDNFINARNAQGTGCSTCSLVLTGTAPNIVFTGNGGGPIGVINTSTTWTISFDVTTSLPAGSSGLLQNTALINCVSQSGGNCSVTKIASYLYGSSTASSPQFREVAP